MSRNPLLIVTVVVAVVAMGCWGIAACSTVDDAATAGPATRSATVTVGSGPVLATTAERSEQTAPPPATQPDMAAAPTSTAETTEMPPDDATAPCSRLTDFEDEAANGLWQVVNDDVMGGQSLGGLSFEAASLIFEGDINTDGGGFSSLRLPLEPGLLVPYGRIEFRAQPDGREYMVTFDDDLASRDRRVSHRAPIAFDGVREWQTVSVSFDDLFPAIFGRPIDDLPFRKDLATRLGLMISDGTDGPFRFEIDWIDLCPA